MSSKWYQYIYFQDKENFFLRVIHSMNGWLAFWECCIRSHCGSIGEYFQLVESPLLPGDSSGAFSNFCIWIESMNFNVSYSFLWNLTLHDKILWQMRHYANMNKCLVICSKKNCSVELLFDNFSVLLTDKYMFIFYAQNKYDELTD